jgi:hypothetical protein
MKIQGTLQTGTVCKERDHPAVHAYLRCKLPIYLNSGRSGRLAFFNINFYFTGPCVRKLCAALLGTVIQGKEEGGQLFNDFRCHLQLFCLRGGRAL